MALVIAEKQIFVTDHMVYNRRYIYLVSAVASLGGLLFGYDLSNVSGTITFFSKYFGLTDVQTGWAVGCISIGAAAGALFAGRLSDILGRKKILLLSALLFAVTGIGTGWANTFTAFVIFRVSSGIAIGCATVVCPIYIAEMSPASLRGRLVSYYQLAITIGVLLAYLSNYFLLDTGVDNWRWMFSSQSVPAIFFFMGLLLVQESPRWLVRKKRESEARQILERVGGVDFADAELTAIHFSFAEQNKTSVNNLFGRNVFHIVVTGIGLAIFSQMGGPFTAYGPEIFKDAGMTVSSAFLLSVIIGLILFLFTIVAIITIDKVGRRKLLLCGVAMLLVISLALSLAFYFHMSAYSILAFALAFTAVYAATAGPVTWVVLSEIFPNRVRGNAMSLATLSLWIANFVAISSFPIMKSHLGMPLTFGIYVPIFLIYFLFVYLRVPETKGKSLEEIEHLLTRKS